ncbi:MAG: SMI1/KNR4 family protein [Tatlockia sp.]|nr:SMI1/KNR4 family protein [Tatlockia sp.]
MNTLVDTYIEKLFENYDDTEQENFKCITPATEQSISLLKEIYPDAPIELIEILKKINGTLGTYNKKHIEVDFFPSDDEYGSSYYLCSIEDMLEHAKSEGTWFELYCDPNEGIDREDFLDDEDELFGDYINPDALCKDWLLFAENDYSKLFIDFSPSTEGTIGQIVHYVHDPDMYGVAADSFANYLKTIIDSDFEYLKYDETEDEESESDYAIQEKINYLTKCINSFKSTPLDVSSLTVDIRHQRIPKDGLKKIFTVIPSSITSLKLVLPQSTTSKFEFKSDNFVEIEDLTSLPLGIKSLDLSGNSLGSVDSALLSKIFSNIPSQISFLYLHDNGFHHFEKDEYGDELAFALESLPKTIVHLDLGYNYLGSYPSSQLKKIIKAIPQGVTSLNLRGASIDSIPGNELASVFSIIPENVRILGLRINSLNKRRDTGLDEALKSIPATVTQIDLSWNGLNADDYPSSPNRVFLF